ncbi:hypothetical protein FNB15_16995 [Ferrovibrio terrae]|uniref:Uncharacterized protein n=1 Tax=Ferrovibrio terrae TaxID=2594003 RepID=A0A516H4Z5_9PROT|nr:hypothetical protein [Ferrovibrio terrae]QDO98858.1 hypothetical protein FNB15_16995 [Ferrovibrio terrae]
MGVQTEIIIPRYVVMTRLADSWIPRASHGDVERAEAEAFRWRRIYGPDRTRVAEFLVPEEIDGPSLHEAVTVTALPILSRTSSRVLPDKYHAWREAGLRALALYLGFGLATRAVDLLIIMVQH